MSDHKLKPIKVIWCHPCKKAKDRFLKEFDRAIKEKLKVYDVQDKNKEK